VDRRDRDVVAFALELAHEAVAVAVRVESAQAWRDRADRAAPAAGDAGVGERQQVVVAAQVVRQRDPDRGGVRLARLELAVDAAVFVADRVERGLRCHLGIEVVERGIVGQVDPVGPRRLAGLAVAHVGHGEGDIDGGAGRCRAGNEQVGHAQVGLAVDHRQRGLEHVVLRELVGIRVVLLIRIANVEHAVALRDRPGLDAGQAARIHIGEDIQEVVAADAWRQRHLDVARITLVRAQRLRVAALQGGQQRDPVLVRDPVRVLRQVDLVGPVGGLAPDRLVAVVQHRVADGGFFTGERRSRRRDACDLQIRNAVAHVGGGAGAVVGVVQVVAGAAGKHMQIHALGRRLQHNRLRIGI